MKKNYAVILIGGSGLRFSKEKPKQFFKLKKKEIIYYSIYNFLQSKEIDRIVVVINKNDEKFFFKRIIKKYFYSEYLSNKILYCFGGEKRINSTENAILFIENTLGDCKNVLIHDGCRPLLSQDLINNLINEINDDKSDCVIPVLKVSESIKYIEDEKIESKNRDFFYIAQTPQICKFETIVKCFKNCDVNDCDFFTNDESGFLEKNGSKISFIDGDRKNIKITFEEDLKLARLFLENKN